MKRYHDITHSASKILLSKPFINLSRLIVFSDFDHTLTRKYCPDTGNDIYTTFSLIENSSLISKEFKEENRRLFRLYHKYEVDTSIDVETRQKFSREWLGLNQISLLKEGLTKDSFKHMAEEAGRRVTFRSHVKEFLQWIYQHNIPLYVISAGIQDSLDALLERDFNPELTKLKEKDLFTSIGNKLLFDEKGNHIGFSEEVYSYNKGDIMKNKVHHSGRDQFLMLGDHLWDINALDSFNGDKFTIGFANFNGKDISCPSFGKFISTYDLTIINDGSFSTVLSFLESNSVNKLNT